MATIKYTIISGVPPFKAELVPSLIPANVHSAVGTYKFDNVPNGVYNLTIVDSNDCKYVKGLTINPYVTTTTTTIPPGDSIIIGNTNDETLIFNENGTNRDDHYIGYPDSNVSTLYFWLKTLNGAPISTQKVITYNINGGSGTTLAFNSISDQAHVEVVELVPGPAQSISGQLILKNGFIETFFQYTYVKNPAAPNFDFNVSSNNDWLYTDVLLTDNVNIYGITYIDRDNAILKY